MKTRIVRIGNSQGVRRPKLLLERSNLAEEVELQAHDGQITIRSARGPREGWGEKFQTMAAFGDDGLLDNNSLMQTCRSLPQVNAGQKTLNRLVRALISNTD